MGSPFTLRMKRFDERRVNDLQNIQYQVVNFYQRKGILPNNLDELKDPIAGFNIPLDPDPAPFDGYNPGVYGYEKISDLPTGQASLSFKICANFGLESDTLIDSKSMTRPVPVRSEFSLLSENWQHKKGLVCFDRKIDKDLYPILKTPKI